MNVSNPPDFDVFTLEDFRLESGSVLPQVRLAYRINGTPTKKPPILTCSAFSHNYDDLARESRGKKKDT